MTDPEAVPAEAPSPAWAKRYLRIFAGIVGVSVVVVVSVNLVAFRLMMRPDVVVISQLRSGWSRTYKPIIQDRLKPETVVFGASWARDAFDPDLLAAATGAPAVNHGISRGHPYECRRFLQSALAADPALKTVILNMDSFIVRPRAVRFEYGFDEAILNVDARGVPNPYAPLHRGYSVTLSGAAMGANLELFGILLRLRSGATKQQLAPAYEQRDWGLAKPFQTAVPLTPAKIDEILAASEAPPDPRPFSELAIALDAAAARGAAVYLYFTPTVYDIGPNSTLADKLATLAFLSERARKGTAKLALYNFDYPNVVTMEARTNRGRSLYYRPDSHPRPTVGELMAARMFGKPFPDWAPTELRADFGVELLTHPDAKGLLVAQERRRAELIAGPR